MRKLGIADEEALQGYFTWRLDRMLKARGRHLLGWDEIIESGLPPGATIMSWRGSEGAVAAAQHGDDVVMTPDPGMYFDHLQSDAPGQPPGRVTTLTLADVYAFDPTPAGLDPAAARHVLGAQANLWSEYLTTPARVEYAAFPRAAALAERVWSAQADWNGFVERLPALFARYRILGVAYADAAVAPQIALAAGKAADAATVTLTQQLPLGTMRYTLDGAEPTPAAPAYTGPLQVAGPVAVRAATFLDGTQVSGVIAQPVDTTALRRRSSDKLTSCTRSLLLRLEGRGEAGAAAPRYNVDVMNPCWIYPQVDFASTQRIDARIGALPYFFQLWREAAKVVSHAPAGDVDELQAHLDTCDGPLLGTVPLGDPHDAARTVSVDASGQRGKHDVCFFFATRGRDPLRLIDWIEPVRSR
jgi:hexosaminidase